MASERSVLREGIIAGLIGAVVVAVWFFAYDLARGRPFHTPGLLGAFVFYGTDTPVSVEPALGPILGYTVLHGLAFVAFGVIAASLMAVSEREPALFVGFIILFACFEAFFFAMVQVFGLSKTGELTWWSVLVGNLLASVAMLWYFFRLHRALPRTLVGVWGAVLGEGVVSGIIGAAVVALWFFAIDAIHGEILRTPRLLGAALLRQQTPVAAVLSYTVVHGAAFVMFGIIGAFLIAGAERQPMLIFALVILFTSFEIFFFGLILIAASWVMDELAGWTVFVGNLLAAAAMLAFYFRRHRTLAHRLATAWEDDS
jgi:hypothetical protein